MSTHPPFRKVFEGVATRSQMFALFNRHSDAPDVDPLSGKPYTSEWFEIQASAYHFMLGLLPPLFQRTGMFGMSEYKAGNVTSVFFAIRIRVIPAGIGAPPAFRPIRPPPVWRIPCCNGASNIGSITLPITGMLAGPAWAEVPERPTLTGSADLWLTGGTRLTSPVCFNPRACGTLAAGSPTPQGQQVRVTDSTRHSWRTESDYGDDISWRLT